MNMLLALRDENAQVSGLTFVIDFKDCPKEVITMFGPTETNQMMKYQVHKSTYMYLSAFVGEMQGRRMSQF